MLDFSNIKISERRDDVHPGYTVLRAELEIISETTLHENFLGNGAKEYAKKILRKDLHHKVYGELVRPIMELIDSALRTREPRTFEKVQKLRSEILELLKPSS